MICDSADELRYPEVSVESGMMVMEYFAATIRVLNQALNTARLWKNGRDHVLRTFIPIQINRWLPVADSAVLIGAFDHDNRSDPTKPG